MNRYAEFYWKQVRTIGAAYGIFLAAASISMTIFLVVMRFDLARIIKIEAIVIGSTSVLFIMVALGLIIVTTTHILSIRSQPFPLREDALDSNHGRYLKLRVPYDLALRICLKAMGYLEKAKLDRVDLDKNEIHGSIWGQGKGRVWIKFILKPVNGSVTYVEYYVGSAGKEVLDFGRNLRRIEIISIILIRLDRIYSKIPEEYLRQMSAMKMEPDHMALELPYNIPESKDSSIYGWNDLNNKVLKSPKLRID